MKTFKLFSMAALALTMAACSNEDNELENVTPAQQGTMHFTATVAAPGSGAMTRTTYSESGTTINVDWKAGDQIYLFDEEEGQVCTATVGTPAASGSATISGTFDYEVKAEEDITATYPASAAEDKIAFNAKFASQAGTIAFIQDNLDYRKGTSKISVNGDQATLATALEMESQIAIWKLTLTTDGSTALSATKVTIKNGSTVIAATTDITATSTVCLALNLKSGNISGADITIEATVGSDTYTYSKSGVSLAKGNYYQSTLKMAKAAPAISFSKQSWMGNPETGEIETPANFVSVSQTDAKAAADAEKTKVNAPGYVCIYALEGGQYKWIDSHGRTGQHSNLLDIANGDAWEEVYECHNAGDDNSIWFTVSQ